MLEESDFYAKDVKKLPAAEVLHGPIVNCDKYLILLSVCFTKQRKWSKIKIERFSWKGVSGRWKKKEETDE